MYYSLIISCSGKQCFPLELNCYKINEDFSKAAQTGASHSAEQAGACSGLTIERKALYYGIREFIVLLL
jgi:hypothetical protein